MLICVWFDVIVDSIMETAHKIWVIIIIQHNQQFFQQKQISQGIFGVHLIGRLGPKVSPCG